MAKLTTFSAILAQLVNESKQSTRKIVKDIDNSTKDEQTRVSISYPAFASYKNFDTVPSYEKAKKILSFFDYDISDNELTEVLNYSRQELKKIKDSDSKDMRQGIRLSPANFGLDSADDLSVIIQRRITELGVRNRSVNTYISELIKKDLQDSGYIQ